MIRCVSVVVVFFWVPVEVQADNDKNETYWTVIEANITAAAAAKTGIKSFPLLLFDTHIHCIAIVTVNSV